MQVWTGVTQYSVHLGETALRLYEAWRWCVPVFFQHPLLLASLSPITPSLLHWFQS
jgi:hypothetical protein